MQDELGERAVLVQRRERGAASELELPQARRPGMLAEAVAGKSVGGRLRVERRGEGLEIADPPVVDGLGDEPVDGAAVVVGGEELEPQPAEPPGSVLQQEAALDEAGQGAHGAALVPRQVSHDRPLIRGVVEPEMEAEPAAVALREHVEDAEVQGGELGRKAGPAPGQRRSAERRAGVDAAQDEEEEIIGEGADPVFAAAADRLPQPPA